MTKKRKATLRRLDVVLSDGEWLLVINALSQDKTASSCDLAHRLTMETKAGRQLRLAQLLSKTPMKGSEIQKTLHVSRQTLFRDLNQLQEHGFETRFDDDSRYHLRTIPKHLKNLFA